MGQGSIPVVSIGVMLHCIPWKRRAEPVNIQGVQPGGGDGRVQPALAHTGMPIALLSCPLLLLINTDLNERFHQVLERWQRVCWTKFESLRWELETGNFCLELFALLGGLTPANPTTPTQLGTVDTLAPSTAKPEQPP